MGPTLKSRNFLLCVFFWTNNSNIKSPNSHNIWVQIVYSCIVYLIHAKYIRLLMEHPIYTSVFQRAIIRSADHPRLFTNNLHTKLHPIYMQIKEQNALH